MPVCLLLVSDFMKKRKRVCSANKSPTLAETTAAATTTTEPKKARMSNS
jgi:hypothetical protein